MRRITRILVVLISLALVVLAYRPLSPPLWGPKRSPVPVTIVFTGDILLAGRVERLIQKQGPVAPLAGVRHILANADLAIGNVECPVARSGEAAHKRHTFLARPESADALREAGIDLVTLANNHTADYGPDALLETKAILQQRQILTVGAGRDSADAGRFVVLERGSPPVRIAVLAFSNMLPTYFYATEKRAGTNPARPDKIKQEVAAARARADLVIALFHWGEELSSRPSHRQRYLAQMAVDAGADLVIGHHPHVLQGLERRKGALIAYSLGNFLFPSRGEAAETMILRYVIAPNGSRRVEAIPCSIRESRPYLACAKARERILDRLRAMSQPLGTEIPPDASVASFPQPAQPRLVDKARCQP